MALNGIDVSGWQPANISDIVPYDFIIIKATEGTSFVSRVCDTQYQKAKAQGKLLGFYHFASGLNPEAEARFFYQNTKNYVGEAIPVLDFEADAVPKWGDAGARRFLDEFTRLSGVRPLIYTSGAVARNLHSVAKGNYGLWVASWGSNPVGSYHQPHSVDPSPFPFVVIHQYTSRGTLPGYSGSLDLNLAYLTPEQWSKYANPSGAPAPQPENDPQPHKTVAEVAQEVWAGKWGNDPERSRRLTEAGYDANAVRAEVNRTAPSSQAVPTYTVKQGDSLSKIAQQHGTTWQKLQKINGIKDANLIYPGQVLRLR